MYRDKYLKYKNKFINLRKQIEESELVPVILENKNKSELYLALKNKQLGGDNCSTNFQDNYSDKSGKNLIYIGMTDLDGNKVVDTPCNTELYSKLYSDSKIYLDSLSPYYNFILWMYTIGSTAKIINNYQLGKYTIADLFNDNMTEFNIDILNNLVKVILEIYIFKNKFKITISENLAKIYDILIERILNTFKIVYKMYLKILASYKKDKTLDENQYKEESNKIKIKTTYD